MHNKSGRYLLGLVLTMLALPAQADGPVWKVSKGGYQLYLGGTIHLLAPNDYPLPSVFDLAYERASQVILELDMREIQGPDFQQAMLQATLYTDDTTLQDVLKPDTYALLAAQLGRYGEEVLVEAAGCRCDLLPDLRQAILDLAHVRRADRAGAKVEAGLAGLRLDPAREGGGVGQAFLAVRIEGVVLGLEVVGPHHPTSVATSTRDAQNRR